MSLPAREGELVDCLYTFVVWSRFRKERGPDRNSHLVRMPLQGFQGPCYCLRKTGIEEGKGRLVLKTGIVECGGVSGLEMAGPSGLDEGEEGGAVLQRTVLEGNLVAAGQCQTRDLSVQPGRAANRQHRAGVSPGSELTVSQGLVHSSLTAPLQGRVTPPN